MAPSAPTAFPALPPQLLALAPKTNDFGLPKSIIIHGKPGTRKTSTAGAVIKVPEFKNKPVRVAYIDIDNGTEVFVNDPEVLAAVFNEFASQAPDGIYRDAETGEPLHTFDPTKPRIFIAQLDKTKTLMSYDILLNLFGYSYVDQQTLKEIDVEGVLFQLGFDIVILDALDVAQEVIVAQLLATTVNEHGKLDSRKAWGEVKKWTNRIAWKFQNTPSILGIIVMHTDEETSEVTGLKTVKPLLSGGAKETIAGVPSLVAYLELIADKDGKTILRATVGDAPGVTSKNRYSFSAPIDGFDLEKLYSIINDKRANRALAATPVPASPAGLA